MRIPKLSGLLLAMGASLAAHAIAPWTPLAGPGGGVANRLAMDGSRICAATPLGIYCTERDREDWRPTYLEGRNVFDLAKTRSGWVALLWEPTPENPFFKEGLATYVSRDGGAHWVREDWSPLVRDWSGHLSAYGDSLLATVVEADTQYMALTEDGGLTWKRLIPPDGEPVIHCVPAPQSVLCAAGGRIVRTPDAAGGAGWEQIGGYTSLYMFFAEGRIYSVDSLAVLSVYGPAGLERRLPALPGIDILLASDSLILAQSDDEYAYVRGRSAAWTRVAKPYGHTVQWRPNLGVWTGNAAVLPSPVPIRVSLEGGTLAFTPFDRGLRSTVVRDIGSSGRQLLATTAFEVWRRDPAGDWGVFFRSHLGIGRFWHDGARAVVTPAPDAAPSQFTVDSGKTWHAQPATLPGRIQNLAKVGERYLALVARFASTTGGDSANDGYALYEAGDLAGAWTSRAEYGKQRTFGLLACGRRLYCQREEGRIYSSLDTGRTWSVSPARPHIDWYAGMFPPDLPRMYGFDSAQRYIESSDCGDSWTLVQMPQPTENPSASFAYALTGQPFAIFSTFAGDESRVYPLPGAPPGWSSIETHALPGPVRTLHLHEGILYATVPGKGLYALDPSATAIGRPKTSRARAAPSPPRLGGWRRVDGRALPPGAAPAQAPRFRPGAAR